MGGVTLALTLATMGLAGPILGTGARLGTQVLFWGGSSAINTMTTMSAGSLYTSSQSFSDPAAQAIWSQGAYGPEQILTGGGIAFTLGALGPVAQWLFRGGNTQVAQQLVAASEAGQVLPSAAGVEAQVVQPGVVHLRVAQQPGTMELTRQGWRLFMQAGSEESVIASGSWLDDVLQPSRMTGPSILSGDLHGAPFAAGVSPQGWGVYAPSNVAAPFQMGLWDDLAGAGGTGTGLIPNGLLPAPPQSGGLLPLLPAPPQGGGLSPLLPHASSSTAIVPWGDPGWSGVPGNALVTSPTSGTSRFMWQWYEDQVAGYQGLQPGELQVPIQLPQPMQFPGRTQPQNSIVLDYRTSSLGEYGEIKHRNWALPSNVEDLIGSLQRMYTAQNIDAASAPQAANAPIVVFLSRPLPIEVHNTVMARMRDWLQGQGLNGMEVLAALSRLRFHVLPPAGPP